MYERILVPLDGSELAEQALAHAQALAKSSSGTIHLVHVSERTTKTVSTRSQFFGSDNLAELNRQFVEAQATAAHEYLDHVAERLKREGIPASTELHEGKPHEHIVEYVKRESIDLVIMSTHGHGGLKRLIGSVTDRVVGSCVAPVLVVSCSD